LLSRIYLLNRPIFITKHKNILTWQIILI
jgi:hypothetical protein